MSWLLSWATGAEMTPASLEARASLSDSGSGDISGSDDTFDWPPLSPEDTLDVDTGDASTRDVPVAIERDDDGEALLEASIQGEATKVWELVESGVDVNTRQKRIRPHEGMTPLHYACQRGDIRMVETLLDTGAEVDAIDSACGATPLQEAALAGHVEIVRLLLKAGADVNARYNTNSTRLPHHNTETPVYLASRLGWLAVVATLVQAGAKVDIANRLGQSPLHVAAMENHPRVVERLLAASADVNIVDGQGHTPLHVAIQNGHRQVALLLLKAPGINVEICEPKNQNTAMHMAAEHELPQVIEALIRANATVNVASKAGVTPLHIACWSEVPTSVRLLLDAGADVHAETLVDGLLPIDYAFPTYTYTLYVKVPETLAIIRLLLSYGSKWDQRCDEEVKKKYPPNVGPAVRMCVELWKAERAQDCPLSTVPIDVIESGREATVTYIKELQSSKVVTRRRKVCLVGPSRWGKSSLIQSIKSKKPRIVEEADRTIGVETLSIRAESDTPIGMTHHDHITFWDFAGHDEYHAAHSVFYSRNTLYLVCIDVLAYRVQLMMVEISADTPEEKTRFLNEFMDARVLRWVLAVVAVRPDAEFEFVLTKCDTWPDWYELLVLGTQSRDEDDFESEVLHGLYTYVLRIQGIVDNLKKVRHTRERLRDFRGSQDGSQEEISRSTNEDLAIVTTLADPRLPDIEYIPPIRVPAFTSCVTPEHLQLSTTLLWPLLFKHDIGFPMPEKYSRVLAEAKAMRSAVEERASNATRIQQSMVDVKGLVEALCERVADLDKATCRVILRALCDLGDVLWFEDLGNDKLRDTVFLEPRLMMDFIRQIINHKHAHETISHAAIKGLPLWSSLDRETMCAMKRLLQHFQLVHPTAGDMAWDSDLLVPAFRRTQSYAVFIFWGQDLTLRPGISEARHVHWEYHFENWLPGTLFDHVAVASYHPMRERRAGPDWILYGDAAESTYACRLMISRDSTSKHQTIQLEAVLATSASSGDGEALWDIFVHVGGSLERVLRRYKGLIVSKFAMRRDTSMVELSSLFAEGVPKQPPMWMPPHEVCEKFKTLELDVQLEACAAELFDCM